MSRSRIQKTYWATTTPVEHRGITNNQLGRFDRFRITAGEDMKRIFYDFIVLEPGEAPRCALLQTSATGKVLGPNIVDLVGSGLYTTREENPCQKKMRAFTVSFGYLAVGSELIVDTDNPESRRQILMPKINSIVTYD